MEFTLEELAQFLVKAKIHTYAGDGPEVSPQRPGFRELEFLEGDFGYRDSYVGFYFAPGQEVVRFRGDPVWTMAYSGGMNPEYHGLETFSRETYDILKRALLRVEASRPFRGPECFSEGDWLYRDSSIGDITNFIGDEQIFRRGREMFRQHYIGGIIVPR